MKGEYIMKKYLIISDYFKKMIQAETFQMAIYNFYADCKGESVIFQKAFLVMETIE